MKFRISDQSKSCALSDKLSTHRLRAFSLEKSPAPWYKSLCSDQLMLSSWARIRLRSTAFAVSTEFRTPRFLQFFLAWRRCTRDSKRSRVPSKKKVWNSYVMQCCFFCRADEKQDKINNGILNTPLESVILFIQGLNSKRAVKTATNSTLGIHDPGNLAT